MLPREYSVSASAASRHRCRSPGPITSAGEATAPSAAPPCRSRLWPRRSARWLPVRCGTGVATILIHLPCSGYLPHSRPSLHLPRADRPHNIAAPERGRTRRFELAVTREETGFRLRRLLLPAYVFAG